jgi:hypothetical protein
MGRPAPQAEERSHSTGIGTAAPNLNPSLGSA